MAGGGAQRPGLVGGIGTPPASAQPLGPAAMGGGGTPAAAGSPTLPSFNWQNAIFGSHGAPVPGQGNPAPAPASGGYHPAPWQPLAPLTMSKPAVGSPFSGNPFTAPAAGAGPAAAANPLEDPNTQLSDDQLGTVGSIQIGNMRFRNDKDIARFNAIRTGKPGGGGDGSDGGDDGDGGDGE